MNKYRVHTHVLISFVQNVQIYGKRLLLHINKRSGCPKCANNLAYSGDKFIEIAGLLHWDKFDYSQITSDHIKNNRSKVPIICKTCNFFLDAIHNESYW